MRQVKIKFLLNFTLESFLFTLMVQLIQKYSWKVISDTLIFDYLHDLGAQFSKTSISMWYLVNGPYFLHYDFRDKNFHIFFLYWHGISHTNWIWCQKIIFLIFPNGTNLLLFSHCGGGSKKCRKSVTYYLNGP